MQKRLRGGLAKFSQSQWGSCLVESQGVAFWGPSLL